MQVCVSPHQKRPSLQGDAFASAALQESPASLQLSAQLPSPSGPGHALPACWLQVPPLQLSAPLQKTLSLQGLPLLSEAVDFFAMGLASKGAGGWPSMGNSGWLESFFRFAALMSGRH